MHPAITFKCTFALPLGSKDQVEQPAGVYELGIYDGVMIIVIAIVADGADKALVKHRYKIPVEVHIFFHAAQHLADALVVHADGLAALDDLPSFYRRPLKLIIGYG